MRVERIACGDVVKVQVRGRTVWGEVLEVKDGVVYFRPISPAAGWRHASAREIVGHWRKTGGRRGDNDQDHEPVAHGQLSLHVWS